MEMEYVIVFGNEHETYFREYSFESELDLDKQVNEINLNYSIYYVFRVIDQIKYEPIKVIKELKRV